MDDQKNPDICQPSAGVHIVIPGYYRWPNIWLPPTEVFPTEWSRGADVTLEDLEHPVLGSYPEPCAMRRAQTDGFQH
ncbi:glycerol-3-phosphate dehydrogenase, mitochondrial-like [Hippoglossus hippoglossus]|uniref:glycerol-3-phosphate dehydrogenase, mitochondrial-like n=1 Tax=Hippoglossus hippoglossus TaxID=8267 RepID=UPI00148C6A28|nr:glycerol-3-phosphate dehydrogenase, mitochondrial-like [Hippoglossus hippoglossus]